MCIIVQSGLLLFLIVCVISLRFRSESFQSSDSHCVKHTGCNTFKESIMSSLGSPAEYKYECHQNLKDGATIITSNSKHVKNLGTQTAHAIGNTCAQISKRQAELNNKRSELNATKQNMRSLKQLSDGKQMSTDKYKANTGGVTIQGQIRETRSEISTQKEQIKQLREQLSRLEKK